jgi:hypothetical protein
VSFDAQFAQWFLRLLIERLEQLEVPAGAESHVVTRPAASGQASTGPTGPIVTPRQSNLLPRPTQPLTVLDGNALGDTPRSTPFLPTPQGSVIPVALKPPPPFGSLACVPDVTAYSEWADDDSQARFYPVHSKALAPAAGDAIADFPVDDDVREKLWRRVGVRGSPYPAWGEWEFITQEYPDGPALLQSGWDGEPYVAGVMKRDWPQVRVAETVPLFIDDSGRLLLPDDTGVFQWVLADAEFAADFRVVSPAINVWDGSAIVSRRLYDTVELPLMASTSHELFGFTNPTLVDVPVKRYKRAGADTVGDVVFAEWVAEHTLTEDACGGEFDSDTGTCAGNVNHDGALTFSPGEHIANLTGAPNWWSAQGYGENSVAVGASGATTFQVSLTNSFRSYLLNNECWVRFPGYEGEGTSERRVTDIYYEETDDGDVWYITLSEAITLPTDALIQRYEIGVPKTGSPRAYYVVDEVAYAYRLGWLVQVSRAIAGTDTNAVTYRVHPAYRLQVSRRLRLYDPGGIG